MAINIPQRNTDHGARNRILLELAREIVAQGGAMAGRTIAQSAGETEPNWQRFLDGLIIAANGMGGVQIPRYTSIDYNSFYFVASQIANKLNTAPPITPPANTTAPSITGTATVGFTLTCNPGVWTNSPSYSYQWLRNGTNIALNGTNATYTLIGADAGAQVACRVTGTNAGGSANATSNAVTVAGAPPVNTVAPVASFAVDGSLGDVASVTNGTWNGAPTGYTYQWRRNNTNIGGATAATHTIVALDSGNDLSCNVTATNAGGPTTAPSNALTVP
jgi:hypothetical protein